MSPADRRSGGRWIALGGVWLIYTCFGLVTGSLAPLVAEVRVEFGIGPAAMGAIMGAWPLVYALTAVPCGVLLDRIGAGPGVGLAALTIAASAAARGMAQGPTSLFLATALLGVGGPLISVGAPKLVSALFDGRRRGLAMGLYITGPSAGAIAAMTLTHPVLLPIAGSWRGVMGLHAAAAVAAGLVWALIVLRSHSVPRPERAGASSPTGSGLRRILTAGGVPRLLLIGAGIFFVNHALNNWLVEVLRSRGSDPAEAGLRASLPVIVGLVAAPIVPALASARHRPAVLAALLAATCAGVLMLFPAADWATTAGLVLQGVARGAGVTLVILMLLDLPDIAADDRGAMGGVFFTVAEIGGVLGPLAFGALGAADPTFATALWLVAAVCLALTVVLHWVD